MTGVLYIAYRKYITTHYQSALYLLELGLADFQFLQEILYSQRRKFPLLYSIYALIWFVCKQEQRPAPINESNKSI